LLISGWKGSGAGISVRLPHLQDCFREKIVGISVKKTALWQTNPIHLYQNVYGATGVIKEAGILEEFKIPNLIMQNMFKSVNMRNQGSSQIIVGARRCLALLLVQQFSTEPHNMK
jgi:hypothetical protein